MSTPSDLFAGADAAQATRLPAQRRQHIVDFLRLHGAVTLQQLEQALGVSVSTLRRDLDGLAGEGIVDRTHGGALLRQQNYATFEPEAHAAAELSPLEKQAIGRCAAEALLPRQSVIFDSGSTVLEAARAAVRRNIPLTAVTNDLDIAQLLGSAPQIQVHVLGGVLRPGSATVIGQALIDQAAALRVDVLLIGAHAVTDGVLSETSGELAAVKRALIGAATVRRLLVDASKFRPRAFMQVATLADIHEVICDDALPADEQQGLRERGVTLTLVAVR